MNNGTAIISIVYSLLLLGFTIAFFVEWYRKRHEVQSYRSYGFIMGFILIGFEIVLVVLLAINGNSVPFLTLIFGDTIAFFRISAITIVGIYYCLHLEIPSFPFLLKNLELARVDSFDSVESFNNEENEPSTEQFQTEEDNPSFRAATISESQSKLVMPSVNVRETVLFSSIVAAGGILYSILLFWLTKPTMSAIARANFGQELTMANLPTTLVFGLSFAFAEEIVFRLGIQNFLARLFMLQGRNYWSAIILTSLIWTIGHFGLLEPNWVKMVQIFPVGLALGWLFKRYGVESTIIVHGIFNVALIWPSELLLS